MTTLILPVNIDHRPTKFTQHFRDDVGGTKLSLVVHTRDEGIANDYFRKVAQTPGLVPVHSVENDAVPWWQVPFVTVLGAITFVAVALVLGALLVRSDLFEDFGSYYTMLNIVTIASVGWIVTTIAVWISMARSVRKTVP